MEKRKISASLRAAAIATLTLQNGAQALLVRYSKEARRPGAPPYLGSSVVLVCELVKLLSAAAMLKARAVAREHSRLMPSPQHHQSGDGRAAWLWRGGAWRSSLLFAPPAAVYAVQNNLLLVAALLLLRRRRSGSARQCSARSGAGLSAPAARRAPHCCLE